VAKGVSLVLWNLEGVGAGPTRMQRKGERGETETRGGFLTTKEIGSAKKGDDRGGTQVTT